MKAILTIGNTSWLCPNAAAAAKVADALSALSPIDKHYFPATDIPSTWGPNLAIPSPGWEYETRIEPTPDAKIASLTTIKKLYADATAQVARKTHETRTIPTQRTPVR